MCNLSQELRQLKHALKEDYKANEEEMPVNLMKPIKGERKKKKNRKHDINAEVVQMIEVSFFHNKWAKKKGVGSGLRGYNTRRNTNLVS